MRIQLANAVGAQISGNTFVGTSTALQLRSYSATPSSDIVVNNNRSWNNVNGITLRPDTAFASGAVNANDNWWGANGGPGSVGARPGAPNPVNNAVVQNASQVPVPDAPQMILDSFVVGGSTGVTASALGEPVVNHPLFTSLLQPVVGASVVGGIGTVSGFDTVPVGGTLVGTFTATTEGTGSIALPGRISESGQPLVPCSCCLEWQHELQDDFLVATCLLSPLSWLRRSRPTTEVPLPPGQHGYLS